MPESRLARTRAAYEGGTLTPEPGETARERVERYRAEFLHVHNYRYFIASDDYVCACGHSVSTAEILSELR